MKEDLKFTNATNIGLKCKHKTILICHCLFYFYHTNRPEQNNS